MTLNVGDKVTSELFDEIGIVRSMIELNNTTMCIVKFGDDAYKLPADKLEKVHEEAVVEITRKDFENAYLKAAENFSHENLDYLMELMLIDPNVVKSIYGMMGEISARIDIELFGEDVDA